MSEFATRAAEWATYYATLGGVSATMAGLLFTSLALNPKMLHNLYLKAVAQQAFMNFSCLLLLALVLLQPQQKPLRVALTLVSLGLVALGRIVFVHVQLQRTRVSTEARWASRLMGISALAYALLLPSARLILQGQPDTLYTIQAVTLVLLIGTGRLCWELLLHGQTNKENDNA